MATDLEVLPVEIPQIPGKLKTLDGQELARLFKIEKSATDDELARTAIDEHDSAMYSIARAGAALLLLKSRSKWGEFSLTLEKNGVSSQRASELMRVAEKLSELPAEEAQKIAKLRPTVVIALARFSVRELIWASQSQQVLALARMRSPEIAEWRRRRRMAAARGTTNDDPSDKLEAPTRKPLEVEVATDEVIGAVTRAQIELARATRVVDELLPHQHDDWEGARTELAHVARKVIAAIKEQADALDGLLFKRFGTFTLPSEPCAYRVLPRSRVDALSKLALDQAEQDTHARTVLRNDRVTPKPKGAPPKTLDTLLAKFHEVSDG